LSVIPILLGFDFQARWFWLEALRLLRRQPALQLVSIEDRDTDGFDDVVSRLVPARSSDVWEQPIAFDAYQAKFHVDHRKSIGWADLGDPEFIGAKRSLLERVRDAAADADRQGERGRFTLVSPWALKSDDPVRKLWATDGNFRRSELFDGTGDRSATGRIRKAWRDHLKVDDAVLLDLLQRFRVQPRDPDEINRLLEAQLDIAGLEAVPAGCINHPYVDLINAHVRRDERDFDAAALRRSLTNARKWARDPEADDGRHAIAIRSRVLGAVHLEDEAADLLDLVPRFHDRALADGVDWDRDVAPRIVAFARERITAGAKYRLYLDAHASIAFAAGWTLHRADVVPVQSIQGRLVPWPAEGAAPVGALYRDAAPIDVQGSGGPDIAVALGVTLDVLPAVMAQIAASVPSVGRVVQLTVPKPSPTSVVDGAHADALAAEALERIRAASRSDGRESRVHLFPAAPNGLVFQLGRRSRLLGRTTVHEFDFENPQRAYTPGITVPITTEEA
jgi:hypothetical protein